MRMAFGKLGPVLIVALGLGACGTPPPANFQSVAVSGVTFTDSVPPLLASALDQAINANSATLVRSHADASLDAKKKALLDADTAYRARAKIFNDVNQHARTLKAYFVAMEALANTSGDSAIGASAEGLVNELGQLDPKIAAFTIGGQTVGDLTGTVVPLIVGEVRSQALADQLRKNGDDVVRAIDLQRAFLQAVAKNLRSQLETLQNVEQFDRVIKPYLSSDPLPGNWAQTRLTSLKTNVSVETLEAAVSAAENLKLSFIAVAEGNRSADLLTQLWADVSRVAALVKALKEGAS